MPVRTLNCTVGTKELETPTKNPTASVTVENTTARPDARTMEMSAIT